MIDMMYKYKYKYKYKYNYNDRPPHPTQLLQSRELTQTEQFRLYQKVPAGARNLIEETSKPKGSCNIPDWPFGGCKTCARSSDYFSLKDKTRPSENYIWIRVNGPEDIRFDICAYGLPNDAVLVEDVASGSMYPLRYFPYDYLYISKPRAKQAFSVVFYAMSL
jgi:hypothetical protein